MFFPIDDGVDHITCVVSSANTQFQHHMPLLSLVQQLAFVSKPLIVKVHARHNRGVEQRRIHSLLNGGT